MQTHADKTQEVKHTQRHQEQSRHAKMDYPQQLFTDNRPQTQVQRKIAHTISNAFQNRRNHSPHNHLASQRTDNTVQLQTAITHTYDYLQIQEQNNEKQPVNTSHRVGKKMEALLDVDDQVVGTATDKNWTWMQSLRKQYPAAGVVRGHLLNHDLGGFGTAKNLYPISTEANMDHSSKVEQKVKGLLNKVDTKDDGPKKKIIYNVTVTERRNPPEEVSFDCEFGIQGENMFNETILSNLGQHDKSYYAGKGGSSEKPHPNWSHGNRRGKLGNHGQYNYDGYKPGNRINFQGLNNKPENYEKNNEAGYQKGVGSQKINAENILSEQKRMFREARTALGDGEDDRYYLGRGANLHIEAFNWALQKYDYPTDATFGEKMIEAAIERFKERCVAFDQ